MTRGEALQILGFDPDAVSPPANKDILDKYRSLMTVHHTDVGGSPLIAQKLNEAKTMLVDSGR